MEYSSQSVCTVCRTARYARKRTMQESYLTHSCVHPPPPPFTHPTPTPTPTPTHTHSCVQSVTPRTASVRDSCVLSHLVVRVVVGILGADLRVVGPHHSHLHHGLAPHLARVVSARLRVLRGVAVVARVGSLCLRGGEGRAMAGAGSGGLRCEVRNTQKEMERFSILRQPHWR